MSVEIIPRESEEQWLTERRSRVTATDIGRLANGGPSVFAAVKAEKHGVRSFFGNRYTEWGHEREPLIVSDIPYRTISGGNVIGKDGPGKHGQPTGMLLNNDGKNFRHNDTPIESYAADLFRVLKSPGHAYVMTNEFSRRRVEDALLAAGFRTHALLVWKKNICTPNRWYMKNAEFTFLVRKGPARRINNVDSMVCHEFRAAPSGNRDHPTEKPVDLMRFYIENSSQPGDLVMDPFMGAGSTGIAAVVCGRRFLGIEIDREYYAAACRRMGVMP